jgi:hypothetical protein
MRSSRRLVPFDPTADLWQAVREGLVESSDLSPNGKLRDSLLDLPKENLPPLRRCKSPQPGKKADASTQTHNSRESALSEIESLVAKLRAM